MKVYLSKKDMKYKDIVEKFLAHEILYNCNLNGADFKIMEDEFTWIEGIDEVEGAFLMDAISNMIQEQQ